MLGYPLLLYDTVPSKMLNSPTFVALLSKAKEYVVGSSSTEMWGGMMQASQTLKLTCSSCAAVCMTCCSC